MQDPTQETSDQAAEAAVDSFLEEHLDTNDELDAPMDVAALDGYVDGAPDAEETPEGEAQSKILDTDPEVSQDSSAEEQPDSPDATARDKARQALRRIGLDPDALEGSLPKEEFFEAGRRAHEAHAAQQREFERIRAESTEAGVKPGKDGEAAPEAGDQGSSQEPQADGQPVDLPELTEALQPFREIDPGASDALEAALRPIYEGQQRLRAEAQQARQTLLDQTVAITRRDMARDIPALSQPDVWQKVDAHVPTIANAPKYQSIPTLEGRVRAVITDALAAVTSASPESAAATAPTSSGGSTDAGQGHDPLDTMIGGFLDSEV